MLEYTPAIMDAVLNETQFWGARLSFDTGSFISYDVEPFLSSLFTHAPEGSSAYPISRAQGLLPLNRRIEARASVGGRCPSRFAASRVRIVVFVVGVDAALLRIGRQLAHEVVVLPATASVVDAAADCVPQEDLAPRNFKIGQWSLRSLFPRTTGEIRVLLS